jgi:hypothetical protein
VRQGPVFRALRAKHALHLNFRGFFDKAVGEVMFTGLKRVSAKPRELKDAAACCAASSVG